MILFFAITQHRFNRHRAVHQADASVGGVLLNSLKLSDLKIPVHRFSYLGNQPFLFVFEFKCLFYQIRDF